MADADKQKYEMILLRTHTIRGLEDRVSELLDQAWEPIGLSRHRGVMTLAFKRPWEGPQVPLHTSYEPDLALPRHPRLQIIDHPAE